MKKRTKWIILIILLAIAGGVGWAFKDRFMSGTPGNDRPWAYPAKPGDGVLVGKWQGRFDEPGGLDKQIFVEIFEPFIDEEHERKAGRRPRKRGSRGPEENKEAFEGTGTISSSRGLEAYDLSGAVEKADYHALHFSFIPLDEKKRHQPGFILLEAKPAGWKDDDLTVTLSFIHNGTEKPGGGKETAGEEKVTTTLRRVGH